VESYLLKVKPKDILNNIGELYKRKDAMEMAKESWSRGECEWSEVQERFSDLSDTNPLVRTEKIWREMSPFTKVLIKRRGQLFWDVLEPYFDAPTILEFYKENDEGVARELETEEGTNYLNGLCERGYSLARKMIWNSE